MSFVVVVSLSFFVLLFRSTEKICERDEIGREKEREQEEEGGGGDDAEISTDINMPNNTKMMQVAA